MKRGGVTIALVVLLTGALRWFSPGTLPVAGESAAAHALHQSGEAAHVHSFTTPLPATQTSAMAKKSAASAAESLITPETKHAEGIAALLHDYFGRDSEPDSTTGSLDSRWYVPASEVPHTRFVVAILPDPVHTQLNLYFDRGIEAAEQAAQESGFNFDRAFLPWDVSHHPESSDYQKRDDEERDHAVRESFPGLLIFRRAAQQGGAESESQTSPRTLLLFIVAEAPTGGVHKEQFAKTLSIIDAIHGRSQQSLADLFILGPTFSGSLDSLARALDLNKSQIGPRRVVIYSGTVRGTNARCSFESRLHDILPQAAFASFQDNESHLMSQFLSYAKQRGYEEKDIAILSEDETAYGNAIPASRRSGKSSNAALLEPACSVTSWGIENLPNISFPRGISQFRSAYIRQTGAADHALSQGRAVLPLDLAATGNSDDSVPPFAAVQFPLSQEAVMIGIISRLHQYHPRLIVLRSSDPVDQLFLARYLRQYFPQGRIVVSAPDLLFAREDDGLLHGVLGIGAYPLVPDLDRFLSLSGPNARPSTLRTFPSSVDSGVYNALIALLGESSASQQSNIQSQSIPGGLPVGHYSAYGNFIDWKNLPDKSKEKLFPDDWVTILGHDGFCTLDHLENDSTSGFQPIHAAAALPAADQDHVALEDSKTAFSRHTSRPFAFAYALILLLLVVHTIFVWVGSIFLGSEGEARFGFVELPPKDCEDSPAKKAWNDWNHSLLTRRSALIAIGTASLFLILETFAGIRFAAASFTEGRGITLLLSLPPLFFVLCVAFELYWRRGCRRCGIILSVFSVVITFIVNSKTMGPYAWLSSLTAYRAMHFTSGVSPLLPLVFLMAAAYCLAWFELQGLSLLDCRRPLLPSCKSLPTSYYRVSEDDARQLISLSTPLSVPWRVLKGILVLVPLLVLTVSEDVRPILTMEGEWFDRIYALLLFFCLSVFLGCLFRLRAIWNECRRLLAGLDSLHLREAFRRLEDFKWSLLWSPSGSAMRDSYKLVSREIESIDRIKRALENPAVSGSGELSARDLARLKEVLQSAEQAVSSTRAAYASLRGSIEPPKNPPGPFLARIRWRIADCVTRKIIREKEVAATGNLVQEFAGLQKQLAQFAGTLLSHALDAMWDRDLQPVASTCAAADDKCKKSAFQVLAEEYVSLVYANYLSTILLRLRSIVVEAIGIYLCLLLSISFYPFEPNPAMFTLAVLLVVVMAVVVGYVYAQMHKDAALSRLTSTNEGELGIQFWLQFIAAGAVPVLSLLAVQFPTISRFVGGLLQPALQAIK